MLAFTRGDTGSRGLRFNPVRKTLDLDGMPLTVRAGYHQDRTFPRFKTSVFHGTGRRSQEAHTPENDQLGFQFHQVNPLL